MGRLVRDSRLESREARSRLKMRKEPYWRLLSEGIHLGYYRGDRGGIWHVRVRLFGDSKRYIKSTLGKADDIAVADDDLTLSFSQAQESARKFADKIFRGEEKEKKEYLVQHAVEDYLADFKAQGKKSFYSTEATINAHILPFFGLSKISALSFKQLNTWKNDLATSPKRIRTSKGKAQQFKVNPNDDPEYQRKRRVSANRVINVFKAILNHAYKTDRVQSNEAWQKLKPFAHASEPKIRFLSEDESIRLLNACEPDFRLLVRGALLTGARYSELTNLKVSDYINNQSIYIHQSKSGKPRHVPLNDEGIRFFNHIVIGKKSHELIFTRVNQTSWKKNYQVRPLMIACQIAEIKPAISFHDLRHTYASALAMKGVPLQVISAVLGHSDTRITHKHYAHLMPSYIADVIRQHLPNFGKTEKTNVTQMKQKIVSNLLSIPAKYK